MKKGFVVLFVLLVGLCSIFADSFPQFQGKVFITSAGQSADGDSVVALLKRNKYTNYNYEIAASVNEIDWNGVNTLVLVIGGSGKGLGAAGTDVTGEQKRLDSLIDYAKSHGIKVLGMHIGGEDRRGANSAPFVPYAEKCDALIVMNKGNKDGYFTGVAASKNIPIAYFDSAAKELSVILKDSFV